MGTLSLACIAPPHCEGVCCRSSPRALLDLMEAHWLDDPPDFKTGEDQLALAPIDQFFGHDQAGGIGRLCGRSHSDAWMGCIVCSITASSSPVRLSRSTCWRRRVLKAAIVRPAS